MALDFKSANATAAQSIRAICRKYLPDGREQGSWWIARVPWREDKTPSLGVSLTTGRYKDFGRNEGGDTLSLLAKLRGCTAADIVREMQGTE